MDNEYIKIFFYKWKRKSATNELLDKYKYLLKNQLLNCSVNGYTKQCQKRYICHKHTNIYYNDLSDNHSDEWSD